ncbi:unnamed protein product [Diplocarpon coronariae]
MIWDLGRCHQLVHPRERTRQPALTDLLAALPGRKPGPLLLATLRPRIGAVSAVTRPGCTCCRCRCRAAPGPGPGPGPGERAAVVIGGSVCSLAGLAWTSSPAKLNITLASAPRTEEGRGRWREGLVPSAMSLQSLAFSRLKYGSADVENSSQLTDEDHQALGLAAADSRG